MTPQLVKGGLLQSQIQTWKEITNNKVILNTIENGYSLEFCRNPTNKVFQNTQTNSAEELEIIVQEYLEREIIEESTEIFISSPFYLLKQKEKVRPILDLRYLNNYLKYNHFQMESLKTAATIMEKEIYFTKIDLKDAYHSISIAKEHRKYLGFQVNNKSYRFRVVPFGLSTAPRLFTKIMREAIAPLREQSIRMVIYLDGILIMGNTIEESIIATEKCIHHLSNLGFTINLKKSVLKPSTSINFLGMEINSRTQKIPIPKEKVNKILKELKTLLKMKYIKARKLASIIGLLGSVSQGFGPTYIHQRFAQANLQAYLKDKQWGKEIPIWKCTHAEANWWITNLNKLNGKTVEQPSNSLELFTDASSYGWGFHYQEIQEQGMWNYWDTQQSSNYKELKTVLLALRNMKKIPEKGTVLTIRSDNSTTVAQINNQSNPRNPYLLRITKKIWD